MKAPRSGRRTFERLPKDERTRGGVGLAFRIAVQSARQAPARGALIVALIALPTLGLSGLATIVTSMTPTTADTIRSTLGSTQAAITMVTPPDPTLEQNPTDPTNFDFASGEDGPLHHKEGGTMVAPSTILPGVRILSLRATPLLVKTAHGVGSLDAVEGDAADPAFRGKYQLLSGHAPRAANEILVSPAALIRLGVRVGDGVTVQQPRSGEFVVVGTLRDLTQPSITEQLFGGPGAFDDVAPEADLTSTTFYLPTTALSWADVQRLNKSGATVYSRSVVLHPPSGYPSYTPDLIPRPLFIAFPLAAFALLEVVLLAGAAFMVGARAQERALATLASIGADRRLLFRVVAFGGIILGAVGGLVGALLGVGAAAIYMAVTSDSSTTQYPGFAPNVVVLALIVLFGTLAGWIAASLPARSAARTDVVAALRGAQRPSTPSRKRPVVGLVVLVAGTALTLAGGVLFLAFPPQPGDFYQTAVLIDETILVVGAVLMQAGALMIAPLLLRRIAAILAGAGTGARLGSRDTARNTSRSVPALAVVMTTLFIGSAVMTFISTSQVQEQATWPYSEPVGTMRVDVRGLDAVPTKRATQIAQTAEAVERTLHVGPSRVHVLRTTGQYSTAEGAPDQSASVFAAPALNDHAICLASDFLRDQAISDTCFNQHPYDGAPVLWTGSVADLATMMGEPVSAAAQRTLRAGGAVSLYPNYVRSGQVTIEWRTGAQLKASGASGALTKPVRSVSLPATLQTPAHDYRFGVFVLPSTASALGLKTSIHELLVPLPAQPSEAQYDSLYTAVATITGTPVNSGPVGFQTETGPPETAGMFAWGLLILCGLIALGAAAVAIALARADGRRDRYVLTAIGASPILRRSFAFWQTIPITGVGAVIGVTLGTIPILALSIADTGVQQANGAHTGVIFAAPLLQLALAAVGLPLLIAAASWATTRARPEASRPAT